MMKQAVVVWIAGMGLVLGCATSSAERRDEGAARAETTESAAPAADASTAVAKKDPDALVCETVQVTGSRLPQRVCRTQRQVEQEREAARKTLTNTQRVNERLGQ